MVNSWSCLRLVCRLSGVPVWLVVCKRILVDSVVIPLEFIVERRLLQSRVNEFPLRIKYFLLMLLLDSLNFLLSFSIDSLNFLLVVSVDGVLHLMDISGSDFGV